MPCRDNEDKYYCVAEARNLLVSASQNIQAALRYLPNINVPYCSTKESETLEKAISYVFTDMQTSERHEHALNCYQTTHKRVAALTQWLGQVISTTIARDMDEVTENCKLKAAELRNERVRLIRLRIKEVTGQEAAEVSTTTGTPFDLRGSQYQTQMKRQDLATGSGAKTNSSTDSGVDSELDDSVADEQLVRLFDTRRKGANSMTPEATRMPLVMPTPVPSADLAPMPSNEEIFGKCFNAKIDHNV